MDNQYFFESMSNLKASKYVLVEMKFFMNKKNVF
jgi:hypothetical protein